MKGNLNGKIIILGLLAVFIIWAVVSYNLLVNLKHNVAKAWSNIDVLYEWKQDQTSLKQRFDKNNDGVIDSDEWQSARQLAYTEASLGRSPKQAPLLQFIQNLVMADYLSYRTIPRMS